MKVKKEQKDHIKQAFLTMESEEDFVGLLNLANKYLNGTAVTPFTLKTLLYYGKDSSSSSQYNVFTVRKKSGGNRKIMAPVGELKSILRCLNFVLQCIHVPHEAAMGFTSARSIVNNASLHIQKRFVYNIDIKDFFHSFSEESVKLAFINSPFNLSGSRELIAHLISKLCTHSIRIRKFPTTVLPQGSPTSPIVSNILCYDLDNSLTRLAEENNAIYSRYADDITFSSQNEDFGKRTFLWRIRKIIEGDHNLLINPQKTRLQKENYRQEVTGLIVNSKINVLKKFIKQIRMWIYYWEKYGYARAQELFLNDYSLEKGHIKKGKPNLLNVLEGKLLFLKMVKGEADGTYQKLLVRFNKLCILQGDHCAIAPATTKESQKRVMSNTFITNTSKTDLNDESTYKHSFESKKYRFVSGGNQYDTLEELKTRTDQVIGEFEYSRAESKTAKGLFFAVIDEKGNVTRRYDKTEYETKIRGIFNRIRDGTLETSNILLSLKPEGVKNIIGWPNEKYNFLLVHEENVIPGTTVQYAKQHNGVILYELKNQRAFKIPNTVLEELKKVKGVPSTINDIVPTTDAEKANNLVSIVDVANFINSITDISIKDKVLEKLLENTFGNELVNQNFFLQSILTYDAAFNAFSEAFRQNYVEGNLSTIPELSNFFEEGTYEYNFETIKNQGTGRADYIPVKDNPFPYVNIGGTTYKNLLRYNEKWYTVAEGGEYIEVDQPNDSKFYKALRSGGYLDRKGTRPFDGFIVNQEQDYSGNIQYTFTIIERTDHIQPNTGDLRGILASIMFRPQDENDNKFNLIRTKLRIEKKGQTGIKDKKSFNLRPPSTVETNTVYLRFSYGKSFDEKDYYQIEAVYNEHKIFHFKDGSKKDVTNEYNILVRQDIRTPVDSYRLCFPNYTKKNIGTTLRPLFIPAKEDNSEKIKELRDYLIGEIVPIGFGTTIDYEVLDVVMRDSKVFNDPNPYIYASSNSKYSDAKGRPKYLRVSEISYGSKEARRVNEILKGFPEELDSITDYKYNNAPCIDKSKVDWLQSGITNISSFPEDMRVYLLQYWGRNDSGQRRGKVKVTGENSKYGSSFIKAFEVIFNEGKIVVKNEGSSKQQPTPIPYIKVDTSSVFIGSPTLLEKRLLPTLILNNGDRYTNFTLDMNKFYNQLLKMEEYKGASLEEVKTFVEGRVSSGLASFSKLVIGVFNKLTPDQISSLRSGPNLA